MYFLFLFGAVLVTTSQGFSFDMVDLEKSFYHAEPIPVEVQFISQVDQIKPGDTLTQYRASLCGGAYFEGLVAHFAINLANNPWSIEAGDYITVVAKDSANTTLASNVNSTTKQPQPDFNFIYHAKFKDLFFDVTTGPTPSFVFTLSLSFDFNVSTKDRVMPSEPRWQMTPMEYANVPKGDVFPDLLVPIFKTHTKKAVVTQQLQYLRLDYCFGLSHHYNITITVIADDQRSGFATYACKKTYNQGKCDVKTPYRDISGGPANFVQVSLDGPQDYGPVFVIVRGDGRYKQPNNYILTASSPY